MSMQIFNYALTRDGSYVLQRLRAAFPGSVFTVETGMGVVVVKAPDVITEANVAAVVQAAVAPTFRGHAVRNGDELDQAVDSEILAATGKTKERLIEQGVDSLFLIFLAMASEEEWTNARTVALSQIADLAVTSAQVATIRTEAETFRQQQGW